jgi:hypothetical protein
MPLDLTTVQIQGQLHVGSGANHERGKVGEPGGRWDL